ncbi:MAG: protein O-mannosyl-transferase family [Candidatus Hydrogenedentota bacterium]
MTTNDHDLTPIPRFTRADLFTAGACTLAALAVYVVTLAPTVTGEDSGEFIVSAYALGIPHPPGYPLWCLWGHAFTWLPLGEIAWRVNLSSAVAAAGAVGLLVLIIRMLGCGRVGATAGALAFAFSREFWEQATIAEVYALNALLLAACLFILIRWHETQDRRRLYVLAAVFGLSQGNHNTMALIGPLMALFILFTDTGPWAIRLRCYVLASLAAVATAIAVYTYLPFASVRNPPMDWGDPETLHGWYAHVTRRQLAFMFDQYPRSIGRFINQLGVYARFWAWREFTPWVWLIGMAGFALFMRRRWPYALLTAAIGFVVVAGFSYVQNFPFDKEWLWIMTVFGIPLYMMTGLWIGFGVDALQRSMRGMGAAGIAAVCVLSPLLVHTWHNDKSDYYWAHDCATNVMAQLPPHAFLFSRQDHVSFTGVYLQTVENMRNDVVIGRRYGYLAPEVLASVPPEHRDPAWGDKPLRRHDPAIWAALLRHTDIPLYFTEPPRLPPGTPATIHQEGILYRAVRLGAHWQRNPAIWQTYRWHTLACANTRGDNTAEIIVYNYHRARAAAHLRAKENKAAMASLQTAIDCYGEDVRALNNAGSLLARFGLYEAAADYFQRALAAEPENTTAADNLARATRGNRSAD